jgi:predicted PurR-regulated permease PerM
VSASTPRDGPASDPVAAIADALAPPASVATPPPDAAADVAAVAPADAVVVPRRRRSNAGINLIAVLVLGAALYLGRGLFVPILLAILLALILTPAVRALIVLKLPRVVASLIVVICASTACAGVFLALATPAAQWLERVPRAIDTLERRVSEWRKPLDSASAVTEQLMSFGDKNKGRSRMEVIAAAPSPIIGVLSEAPGMLASAIASVFLTLLLLAHGESLLRKLVTVLPALRSKKELVGGTREAQHELSRYLFAVAVINVGLGVVTAVALWLMGFETAWFWGALVAILNFAPYVGPLIASVLLLLMGVTEETGAMAFAPPAVFLFLHLIEGQIITPITIGHHLAIDPVVLFVGLILFGWMWGIAGLLMAVPILVCLKIIARRVPGGETIATLLSD